MLKRKISIVIFYVSFISANAGNAIDSLKQLLLNVKEDTNKVSLLNSIGREYTKIGNYDTAFYYGHSALLLANQLNYPFGIANSYNNIGIIYDNQSNYNKAIENYFASLKMREEIGDKKGMTASYNNIGIIYYKQNKFEKALDFFFASIKIQKEIGDKQGIAASYNNIGNTYYNQTVLSGNNEDTAKLNQNYEKALENYFASLKIKKEIDDKKGMATTYNNIGIIYSIQSKFEKALESYFASLKVREEIDDKQGIAGSYNNIGNVYLEKFNYSEAALWLQKGMRFAKEIGAKDLLMSSYKGLSDVSEKINDYKKAYEYHQLYSSIKDSIFNEVSSRQMAEMQTKYETEKKDKEILTQQIQISQKQIQVNQKNYIIYGLMILLVLIVMGAYLFIRQNKLVANQKSLELESRLLRSQLNPHFIFNALSAIKTIIPHRLPEESVEYLTKFSHLMRAILETSREEYISLEEEIKIINNYLELQKLRFNNKFDYVVDISPQIDYEQILIPPMLTQPFIENAIEHGIKNLREKGLVSVRMRIVEKTLHIEIEDNGIGFIKTSVPYKKSHKPMAMDITHERLKNLNKTRRQKIKMDIINKREISSSKTKNGETGTKIIISIPLY